MTTKCKEMEVECDQDTTHVTESTVDSSLRIKERDQRLKTDTESEPVPTANKKRLKRVKVKQTQVPDFALAQNMHFSHPEACSGQVKAQWVIEECELKVKVLLTTTLNYAFKHPCTQ